MMTNVRRWGTRPFLLWPCLMIGGLACAAAADGGERSPGGTASAEPGAGPAPREGRAWVIFGTDTVHAEVARTPAEREQGLMNRESVPDGTGMLFVFENEQFRSFWMRNTYVPLDIAFMNASFQVVDIKPLEPLDENLTDSEAPAMFALEVPQGWFEAHGVEVGAVAEIVWGAR